MVTFEISILSFSARSRARPDPALPVRLGLQLWPTPISAAGLPLTSLVCLTEPVKMSNQLDDSEETSQLLPFQLDLLDQLLPEPSKSVAPTAGPSTSSTSPLPTDKAETEVNALLILARGLGMRAIIANLVSCCTTRTSLGSRS